MEIWRRRWQLWWDLQNAMTFALCFWRRAPGAEVSGETGVPVTLEGGGGRAVPGKPSSPRHLSSQPAVMTVSRGSISLVKNALHSPSHCAQSRKVLYLPVENLLLGKNALKEMIFTSHRTFHFLWDNLGIYWSKSTIQERNASAFS